MPRRTGADGALVPLAEQDRTRWDRAAIAEGVELISATLAHAPIGPYQLQAAIAAVHAEAPRADDTDWGEILMLYEVLERVAPNPMVTLNRAVAIAMVHGPEAGLAVLDALDGDDRLAGHHRLEAVRAHCSRWPATRRGAYRVPAAARRTTSLPERRYLEGRAARATPLTPSTRHGRAEQTHADADRGTAEPAPLLPRAHAVAVGDPTDEIGGVRTRRREEPSGHGRVAAQAGAQQERADEASR